MFLLVLFLLLLSSLSRSGSIHITDFRGGLNSVGIEIDGDGYLGNEDSRGRCKNDASNVFVTNEGYLRFEYGVDDFYDEELDCNYTCGEIEWYSTDLEDVTFPSYGYFGIVGSPPRLPDGGWPGDLMLRTKFEIGDVTIAIRLYSEDEHKVSFRIRNYTASGGEYDEYDRTDVVTFPPDGGPPGTDASTGNVEFGVLIYNDTTKGEDCVGWYLYDYVTDPETAELLDTVCRSDKPDAFPVMPFDSYAPIAETLSNFEFEIYVYSSSDEPLGVKASGSAYAYLKELRWVDGPLDSFPYRGGGGGGGGGGGNTVAIAVGASVGGVVLVVLSLGLFVGFPVVFYLRRRKRKQVLAALDRVDEELSMNEKTTRTSTRRRGSKRASSSKTVSSRKGLRSSSSSSDSSSDDDPGVASLHINSTLFEIEYSALEVGKRIGTGGSSATVFKAKYCGKEVAFKCFKLRDFLGSKNSFQEFEREVSMLGSLSHPYILRFYGATLARPRVGIVMEYCPNGDLKHFVEENREDDTLGTRLQFLHEICQGMCFLHAKNVMHRDLKPENVLISASLEARLCDFGISRIMEDTSIDKTRRIGTSHYMAPELFRGDYGFEVDVFAFGVMLYTVLSANWRPYGDAVHPEVMVASDPEFRPKMERHEWPPEAEWCCDLMQRCWDHDPASRPPFSEIAQLFKSNLE